MARPTKRIPKREGIVGMTVVWFIVWILFCCILIYVNHRLEKKINDTIKYLQKHNNQIRKEEKLNEQKSDRI